MKSTINLLVRGAMGLMLGVLLATGCGGPEPDGAKAEENLTTVDMVDCSICATARACCAMDASTGLLPRRALP